MRLLVLVLNIVIGVSLASHVPEVVAATSSKIIKKKAYSQKKASTGSTDVWARIRSGMKIPSFTAVTEEGPANTERYGLKDFRKHPDSSAAAMKLRLSKSAFNSQTVSEPAPRYTELGRSKLGQRNYTELGRKLLGEDASLTNQIGCTPTHSVKSPKGNELDSRNKIALLKLKNLKTAEAPSGLKAADMELRKSTPVSKPIRAGLSVKTSASEIPCAKSQLASNRQRLKGNSLEKQNNRDGYQSRHATANERIDKFIAAYSQNPDFLYRVAERAHPYLYHIVEELGKYRLPLELALLPIVESAYQATAESPKSAKGLWQFIPSTGKDFNLVQAHDYDERLDIPKSTHAAIRFLSGLNTHFNGDWLLALAAYNSGQATVDLAISQNQAEGLPADFWSLHLPEETQDYVPRLLALSKIFARPASYGIKLPSIKYEPYFVKVKIDREFDVNYLAEKEIATIAKLANLNHEQFRRLNPGYLGSTLSPKRSYAFLMPPDNAKQLRQRLASIAQFMSEPALPLNSVVLKEKSDARMDFYDPSLSLVSELVFRKPSDAPKFAAPFLSLNVDGEQSILARTEQPLA